MNYSTQHLTLPNAILILGPTGSGKTPLGEILEKGGLNDHRCHHFDFGNYLRRYADNDSGILSADELAVVKESLSTCTLLEDKHFGIAEKLITGFIRDSESKPNDLIIMNGLPRHTGQATALRNIINMVAVIVLDSTPETVLERIRNDAGGDRNGRTDDMLEQVGGRIAIFYERTLPLIDFYKKHDTQIIRLSIGVATSAEESWKILSEQME
jgi:adenylate kinase